MASRQEIAAVYAAAVIQGIVLVTFPAVSAILTSPAHHGLSTGEYGGIFVPQAVTAILASLLGAAVTRRLGRKRVFQLGLAADLASMALLFGSQFATGHHRLADSLLLAATGCLGIGFGFVVPALNTFTAAFFPKKVDPALLALNALLGLGTALAPVLALVFVGLGLWYGLPVLMSGFVLMMLLFSLRLPLNEAPPASAPNTGAPNGQAISVPGRFWLYAGFALLYGVCETMSGNWATVYMATAIGASASLASLALTLFWISVTGGRILFAAAERWCPPRRAFGLLPFLIVFAFLGTAGIPRGHPFLGLGAFALAGLGCSALLPLVISFGQAEMTALSGSAASSLIGFYQMGYGLAAFGVGPLQTWGRLGLAEIYLSMTGPGLVLAALAFFIVRRRPIPDDRDRPAASVRLPADRA